MRKNWQMFDFVSDAALVFFFPEPLRDDEHSGTQLELHSPHPPAHGQEPHPLDQQGRGRYLSGLSATPNATPTSRILISTRCFFITALLFNKQVWKILASMFF